MTTAAWTLYVADRTGTRLAQIDSFWSFRLVARHNAISTFELELPTDSIAADVLLATPSPRIIARFAGTTVRSGPITFLERTMNGDGDSLVVNGVDDLVWLARRLAHPQPGAAAPPYNGSAYDTRTGNAAQIIAQFVDVNAGPSATVARRVAGLTAPVPAPAGGNLTLAARYQNLLDFVVAAAEPVNLGVRLVDLALGVFVPAVSPAVFSVALGTMAETVSTLSAPTANYVYAAGQGEGTARTVVESSDAASLTDWGRAESFLDRRDTNDPTALGIAGTQELERGVIPPVVTFQPLDTPVQQFGRDWSISSIVQVRVGTVTRTDVVREVTVELSPDGPPSITARIGFSADLALFRAAAAANRRIRQLERV